jgi:hypothetical protein
VHERRIVRATVFLIGWSFSAAAILLDRYFLLPDILVMLAPFAPLAALAVDWRLAQMGYVRGRLAKALWWLNLLPCTFSFFVLLYWAWGLLLGKGFGLSDH